MALVKVRVSTIMLLDFLLLVKLSRSVVNYITKRRRNGLSLGDQSYHIREKTESYVTQTFSKSNH